MTGNKKEKKRSKHEQHYENVNDQFSPQKGKTLRSSIKLQMTNLQTNKNTEEEKNRKK